MRSPRPSLTTEQISGELVEIIIYFDQFLRNRVVDHCLGDKVEPSFDDYMH